MLFLQVKILFQVWLKNSNAIAKGGEFAKKAQEWIIDATKYPAQLSACIAIITGAKMAIVAGYDSSMIIDLLSAAGIK